MNSTSLCAFGRVALLAIIHLLAERLCRVAPVACGSHLQAFSRKLYREKRPARMRNDHIGFDNYD